MCYARLSQPETVTKKIILRYIHSTWLLLSSQKMISGVYTCITWNLCRHYHSTLHSHNLILATLVQLDFKVLHMHNLKSLQGYRCTLHSSTWLLLHSCDFRFYTCKTWSPCRRYNCTLYSHNLTFTTFVQLDFRVLQLHNLKSLSLW